MYILKLEQEQFEGPLELLLSLIEKRRLDVTRLSLAKIAEEYLAYLTTEREVPLENMASFVGVAAQLLLIKSKSLLPFLALDDAEEESIENLEQRLQEYKKFKDAALGLHVLLRKHQWRFGRQKNALQEKKFFYPPSNVDTETLRDNFASILGEIPVFEQLEEGTLEDVVTLEERILVLRETFKQQVETSFHEMISSAESRMDVIVSFLALLELVKQRVIHAEQKDLFVEIRLRKREGKSA